MINKQKILEISKSFYTKFKSLSKPKQFGIAIGAILIILLVSNNDDKNSSRSELNNTSSNQRRSNSNQRKADINLALSKKTLKLPYKIGDLTITKMSANRDFFSFNIPKNGTNKQIEWKVDVKNQTNSEISAVINICDSYSTAVGNVRLEHGYLADCNPIELRMLPASISRNKKFAVSNAWFYRGDTLQICIQGQGCYQQTFIDKPL